MRAPLVLFFALSLGASALAGCQPSADARSPEADDTEDQSQPPPPEAVDACAGRAAGDACSWVQGEEEQSGSCLPRLSETGLVCRREHRRGQTPPPRGPVPNIPPGGDMPGGRPGGGNQGGLH